MQLRAGWERPSGTAVGKASRSTASNSPTARDVLHRGVESYAPFLQPSGELHDPVFGEPTHYATPYHAYANAVLAYFGTAPSAEPSAVAGPDRVASPGAHAETGLYAERALRGLGASLVHLLDVDGPPNAATFDRATGTVHAANHRDFFWSPVLKTFCLLRDHGAPGVGQLADKIASVDILRAFESRPPANWAAVWVSGEWIRIREGLSSYSVTDVDTWIEAFLQRTRLDLGFYEEPGHPNSYDLFTRHHLADLLIEGYDGRYRSDLERLLEAGLRRSLHVQLSDGSLASAHRSTGQTWTLGAQCAYFTHASRLLADRDAALAGEAVDAAGRALTSLARWQRPNGPYSPVENRLPAGYRVGYEVYTADGTYGNLALGFLAMAVAGGVDERRETMVMPVPQPPGVHADHDPVQRVLAHRGQFSVHANAWPAPGYDGFGLVDVTFGMGRFFHLASSVRHVGTGHVFNLGIARRESPGRSALDVLAQQNLALTQPIETAVDPPGFVIEARPHGQHYRYRLQARIEDDRVLITEDTVGAAGWPTLLVPYLRDAGAETHTQVVVAIESGEVRFCHGDEVISLTVDGAIDHVLDLPYGYESRRGLCGLLRIDLRDRAEGVRYRLSVVS